MLRFDTNKRSVFLLYYHLVICTKHKHKVIDNIISVRLKDIFLYIEPTYGITLEKWNYGADHVHAIIRGRPNTEISKFINAYKSASSRLIKKEFPQIKQQLYNEMFWSKNYCLLSDGNVTIETIKQYVQSCGGDKNEV